MAKSTGTFCTCGHGRTRHWTKYVGLTDEYDVRHCMTCTCPAYKHNGRGAGDSAWGERTRYPRRKDMF